MYCGLYQIVNLTLTYEGIFPFEQTMAIRNAGFSAKLKVNEH